MQVIQLFHSAPTFYIVFLGFMGLLMGSFLTVVIRRIPLMMSGGAGLNLCLPRSHCPHCQVSIQIYDNIPLLSYLLLKGRCRHCRHPISPSYPFIEALSTIITLITALKFGLNKEMIFALIFSYALLVLMFIDIEHFLLPDTITLPCLWLGLIVNSFSVFQPPSSAILGAALGYISLWLVYWGFKIITTKEGLGYGDFKLLAMLGAWLGWQSLPFIIFVSSCLGSVWGLSLIFFQGKSKHNPIPFGPFLALAGWLALLWMPDLTQWYMKALL